MIISKTPCRLSFAGGGSDIASYYREHGGAVVSVAIDKYVYLTLQQRFDSSIRIGYSRTEEVQRVDEIQHPIVRHCLNLLGPSKGIEITSHADIPSRGSGLGSSSSFSVGLLNGLHAYQGRRVAPQQLAELACHVEIDLCGDPIGKQDQFAAAFGDLRMYRFHQDGSVSVEPLICSTATIERLRTQPDDVLHGHDAQRGRHFEGADRGSGQPRGMRSSRCTAWCSTPTMCATSWKAAIPTAWGRFFTRPGC